MCQLQSSLHCASLGAGARYIGCGKARENSEKIKTGPGLLKLKIFLFRRKSSKMLTIVFSECEIMDCLLFLFHISPYFLYFL